MFRPAEAGGANDGRMLWRRQDDAVQFCLLAQLGRTQQTSRFRTLQTARSHSYVLEISKRLPSWMREALHMLVRDDEDWMVWIFNVPIEKGRSDSRVRGANRFHGSS